MKKTAFIFLLIILSATSNAQWKKIDLPMGIGSNSSIDISTNYWGIGIDPQSYSPSNTNPFWPGYNYSAVSAAASQSSNSDISCSDENDNGSSKHNVEPKTSSIQTDTCSVTFPTYALELETNFQFKEAYDIMRYWYIPNCYSIANPQATAGALEGSVQVPENINTIDSMLNYRTFVIHCLTLRSDNDWFCSFVADLASTYTDSNTVLTPNYRAGRTIALYLMDNPRCASSHTGDSNDYYQLLQEQYELWQDTAHGSETFDTTIPTMQQLGLDTVLEINASEGVSYDIQTSTILLDARLEGNPTADGGLLWLSIGREAWLNIGVYDVLGRPVPNSGYAGVFEQGTREVPLNVNAPPGTYYIRIQTANNETQTLKLIKE